MGFSLNKSNGLALGVSYYEMRGGNRCAVTILIHIFTYFSTTLESK